MIVTCKYCGAASEYTLDEILSCYTRSHNVRLIEEFVHSGLMRFEIDASKYKNWRSCYHTYFESVKPFRKYGIRVRYRNKHIYLVNENLVKGVNWYE